MPFYSLTFAAFLATTVALYFVAPQRLRVPVLLGASIFFYTSFVLWYIFPLLALIAADYFAARFLERAESPKVRKAWLIVSLTLNLTFLASFKYIPDILGKSSGLLPLGLSFHTFQSMAYMIEVYRGRQAAERSFLVYALYVLFFPQIAAGPIERPQNLLPQFREEHRFSYTNAVAGLQLVGWGLFQKNVVAARLAPVVDAVYRHPGKYQGPVVAFAAICFAFQILADFSGYSDIAIGTAQIMGFRLSRNFNHPFLSDSMAEYWKRWHISLSTWMRDYIFFPLCGNRPGMPRICASIFAVFLANGLWHGARWNYLVSGLLHGTYRVSELLASRAISRRGWSLPRFLELPVKIARTLLVFALMTFAFTFFRGESLQQTLLVLSRLAHGWTGLASGRFWADLGEAGVWRGYFFALIGMICLVQAVQYMQSAGPIRPRISGQPPWLRWSIYYACAVALVVLAPGVSQPFIYFQF
jgi:alginate O-acetyltransferase complex protein AlgI